MARIAAARAFFTQGPEVSHFAYFANRGPPSGWSTGCCAPTTGWWLQADPGGPVDEVAGDRPGAAARSARSSSSCPASPARSSVQGLDGLVRSTIWVDLPQLAFGGLRRLAIDQPGIIAKEPLDLYYGALCRYPRRKPRRAALGLRLAALDPRQRQAFATVLGVRADGHRPAGPDRGAFDGRAGRALGLPGPQAVAAVPGPAGSRLIQLGTPNGGSWSIPYMLMGRDTLMGYLATLDLTMSRTRAAGDHRALPGRPADAAARRGALFDPARWAALAQLDPSDAWGAPRADDLAIAARFRDTFAKAPCDPERMLYVAGHAPTMVGIEREPGGARPVSASAFAPPWRATARSPGAPASRPASAPGTPMPSMAISRATSRPSRPSSTCWRRAPPVACRPRRRPPRAGAAVPASKVRDTVPMFPDAEDLLLAGMGGSREAQAVRSAAQDQDQRRARPSGLCQKSGDGRPLCRRHDQRRGAGARPGAGWPAGQAQGTRPLSGRARHQHGRARSADAGRKARSSSAWATMPSWRPARWRRPCGAGCWPMRSRTRMTGSRKAVPAKREPLRGHLALLVGAGVGGLPIASSVEALLRAVLEAQRVLEGQRDRGARGAGAGRGPRHPGLARARRPAAGQRVQGRLRARPGGQGHAGAGAATSSGDADPSWWQPIQITMEEVGGERVMRYVTTAGRARAEASLVPATPASSSGSWRRRPAPPLRTGTARRRRARAVRAAVARADQGDQPRGPQSAPGGRREDRGVPLGAAGRPAALAGDGRCGRRPAARPAAVRSGLVRQLVQSQFREKVVTSADMRRALVVGDPRAEPEPGFAAAAGRTGGGRRRSPRGSAPRATT